VGAGYYGLLNKVVKTAHMPADLHWVLWLSGLGLAIAFAFVFEALIDYPISQWINKQLKKA
jgi:hypothetical protein